MTYHWAKTVIHGPEMSCSPAIVGLRHVCIHDDFTVHITPHILLEPLVELQGSLDVHLAIL